MTVKERLSSKLPELMLKIYFDKKYYEYYENCKNREKMTGCKREVFEAALSASYLKFKYYKKEDFFSYKEMHQKCEYILNIAFPYSTVELILSIKTKNGVIGGPFSKLAREVAQMRDPSFEYSPPYPKIPFSNIDELQEVVKFGVLLFEDAKQVILSYDDWND